MNYLFFSFRFVSALKTRKKENKVDSSGKKIIHDGVKGTTGRSFLDRVLLSETGKHAPSVFSLCSPKYSTGLRFLCRRAIQRLPIEEFSAFAQEAFGSQHEVRHKNRNDQ